VTDDVRAVLSAKKAEIDAELTALQAPADDAGGISFGKRVGEGTSIAVERITQVDAFDRLQAMRADVVRALAKLDDDSYGRCDGCGAVIPEGRLEARRWAVRCIDCSR